MDAATGIGTAIAAIIASVGSYMLGRRRESGSVATTDADTLWEENRAFREEIKVQLITVRDELAKERASSRRQIEEQDLRIKELTTQVLKLEMESGLKDRKIQLQAETIAHHEQRIEQLYTEREIQSARIQELEERLQRTGSFLEGAADGDK